VFQLQCYSVAHPLHMVWLGDPVVKVLRLATDRVCVWLWPYPSVRLPKVHLVHVNLVLCLCFATITTLEAHHRQTTILQTYLTNIKFTRPPWLLRDYNLVQTENRQWWTSNVVTKYIAEECNTLIQGNCFGKDFKAGVIEWPLARYQYPRLPDNPTE